VGRCSSNCRHFAENSYTTISAPGIDCRGLRKPVMQQWHILKVQRPQQGVLHVMVVLLGCKAAWQVCSYVCFYRATSLCV
jgi:hypothetical protein